MTILFATMTLIYAASLCFVIALFARTLLRERSAPAEAAIGTLLELSPAQAVETSRTDAHAAKSA